MVDEDVGLVGGIVVKGVELQGMLWRLECALRRPGAACPTYTRDVLDGVIEFVGLARGQLTSAIALVDGLLDEIEEDDSEREARSEEAEQDCGGV
jgi:hypothetical protein